MEYTSPSKEELLSSIEPNMRLTKSFIKRIYGYGVTDASFPDKAIAALEKVGCSKARQYYEDWVAEYEAAHNAELKKAAHWYATEYEREWKKRQEEGEERRKKQQKPEWESREQQWTELSIILGYQSIKTER